MSISRKVAIKVLIEIDKGAYSNLVLNKELNKVSDKRDRAFITELVYGVLRQKKRLDYMLSCFSKRPLRKMDNEVLSALRVALYQIEYTDSVPARAAVYETVEALKSFTGHGAVKFTNGVLRSYLRNKDKIIFPDRNQNPVNFLANYYSYPEWIIKEWINKYGFKDTERLCQYLNDSPPVTVRYNRLQVDQKRFLEVFKKYNIEVESTTVPDCYVVNNFNTIKDLPLFKDGGFIVQGPAATLAGFVLGPDPGNRVLDMSAGPGGKTTHLAELMNNRGEIIALDIYEHKLKLIEENCNRLGVNIVKTIKVDGRDYTSQEKFDMVLVDAPCTGLGLVAHKPEIKWNRTENDVKKLQEIQKSLLHNALSLVRDGGFVLYSTCTLTRAENEEVVNQVLQQTDFVVSPVNMEKRLSEIGFSGKFKITPEGYLEFFPPESKTEGFYG
ncbi:16S rRNA (cytosine(967)-C(5))-methyltransferase RsmB [Halothermothrix orenii]|uniref:16S rRNA (cytosine(967)-C(5))-methyltransferase n=1 Tax=Halothermothrix orenii (strain H 168 / OCM 544 / DSM 9562) TaxID=373903 RepID=B8CWT0_HALOH|nr:16S rRNA (cytosine(967)-C(5))-methyltransferase RsmB [Halothermothrix orenii]ACL69749.1 sun protein [Halothermothrix orenii H 168]